MFCGCVFWLNSSWLGSMKRSTRCWRTYSSSLQKPNTVSCPGLETVCMQMQAAPRFGPIRCQKSSSKCMPRMPSFWIWVLLSWSYASHFANPDLLGSSPLIPLTVPWRSWMMKNEKLKMYTWEVRGSWSSQNCVCVTSKPFTSISFFTEVSLYQRRWGKKKSYYEF